MAALVGAGPVGGLDAAAQRAALVPAPAARRAAARPTWRAAPTSGAAARCMSVASFAQVIGPLARRSASGSPAPVGVTEALAVRLERVHSPLDVTGFRVRQLGVVAGRAGRRGGAGGGRRPDRACWPCCSCSAGRCWRSCVVEQRLAGESARWQRRIFLELPVVAEQLGMLLRCGLLARRGAVDRLAARGAGACGRDLERVTGRVRQGLTEVEALREWAAVADVDALRRLVGVLALEPAGRRPRAARSATRRGRSAGTCTAS